MVNTRYGTVTVGFDELKVLSFSTLFVLYISVMCLMEYMPMGE